VDTPASKWEFLQVDYVGCTPKRSPQRVGTGQDFLKEEKVRYGPMANSLLVALPCPTPRFFRILGIMSDSSIHFNIYPEERYQVSSLCEPNI